MHLYLLCFKGYLNLGIWIFTLFFVFWFLDVRNHPVLIHCKRGKVQNLHLIVLIFVVCIFRSRSGLPLVLIDAYSFVNGKYIWCAITGLTNTCDLYEMCWFIMFSLMFKIYEIYRRINMWTTKWGFIYDMSNSTSLRFRQSCYCYLANIQRTQSLLLLCGGCLSSFVWMWSTIIQSCSNLIELCLVSFPNRNT